MKRLSKRQVVMLHEQLICETGGSTGIRDDGLLESALEAPFQEFGGVSVYPSVQQKAARLGFGLIKNHPFVDGNKPVAYTHLDVYKRQDRGADGRDEAGTDDSGNRPVCSRADAYPPFHDRRGGRRQCCLLYTSRCV